jgi:zinc/manganese transport system substrate-binding protein
VLPSYMVRVSRAKLYLKVGLGLDRWADQIVEGSHSSSVTVVDCSKDIPVLEKPTGKIDASMGDIHPDGNPHYWLDPANGAIMAKTIAEALARVDPPHASEYRSRAESFGRDAVAMAERGRKLSLSSRGLITYHRSWTYFANAAGLEILTTIEPIPGIPPTARHLKEVVGIIRERKPLVIFQEPYFSGEAGKFLNRETGIRLVTVSPSSNDVKAGSYLAHFETLFSQLESAGAAGNSRSSGRQP